jgi:hypothetical protein
MTNRIDHTGHTHPNTTAARTACRKALKVTLPVPAPYVAAPENVDTSMVIDTPGGKVRVGSVVIAENRGGPDTEYTVTQVDEDVKNGIPGWVAEGRWGYDYQIRRVIKY